jgi:peptidoglycan hydrolase-like protein with peptidoglycan-binding domain
MRIYVFALFCLVFSPIATNALPTFELAHLRLQGPFVPAGLQYPSVTIAASSELNRRAQKALLLLGYDPGAVDGIVGARTLRALHDWLREHGSAVRDEIDEELVAQLEFEVLRIRLSTAGAAPEMPPAAPPPPEPAEGSEVGNGWEGGGDDGGGSAPGSWSPGSDAEPAPSTGAEPPPPPLRCREGKWEAGPSPDLPPPGHPGRFSGSCRRSRGPRRRRRPCKLLPDLRPYLGASPTLGAVAADLERAFEQVGYFDRSFRGGVPDGFAMLTRLERINEDGTSMPEPDRWAVEEEPGFSLARYVEAHFAAPEGRYRVIVFVVTPEPVATTQDRVTQRQMLSFLANGADRLPLAVRRSPYTDEHRCTALIYEFEQEGLQGRAFLHVPGRLQGRTHLVGAGLWSRVGGLAGPP